MLAEATRFELVHHIIDYWQFSKLPPSAYLGTSPKIGGINKHDKPLSYCRGVGLICQELQVNMIGGVNCQLQSLFSEGTGNKCCKPRSGVQAFSSQSV